LSTSSDDWYRTGSANWRTFKLNIQEIKEAAERWADALQGIERPWLCWNVDPEWCLVQQKLVESVGWTPIVGGDPRADAPKLSDSAVLVDFNASFNLPTLHMLFPVEFTFMYCGRLAFWHSDLLVRKNKLQLIAAKFNSLQDGDMVVTEPRRGIKTRLLRQNDRYWELIACTTRAASRSQFENGAGWFSNIPYHPNCPAGDESNRKKVMWDHGGGIKYWTKKYKKPAHKVYTIKESFIEEGHCSRIRNTKYVPQSPTDVRRDLTKDLTYNFDLSIECQRLGIDFSQ